MTKVAKPTEAQKKAAGANGHVIRLVIKSGNQIISGFNKGKATVMVELVSRLIGKKVAAIHIADDGTIEQLTGRRQTPDCLVVTLTFFFAVFAERAAGVSLAASSITNS